MANLNLYEDYELILYKINYKYKFVMCISWNRYQFSPFRFFPLFIFQILDGLTNNKVIFRYGTLKSYIIVHQKKKSNCCPSESFNFCLSWANSRFFFRLHIYTVIIFSFTLTITTFNFFSNAQTKEKHKHKLSLSILSHFSERPL